MEHILILINRYVNESDPEMLAKFYLAYLDNIIDWTELCVCAEIIDRLLPGDFDMLRRNSEITIINDDGAENALRLMSLGLLVAKNLVYANDKLILHCVTDENDNHEKDAIREYVRTKLGNKFVKITS